MDLDINNTRWIEPQAVEIPSDLIEICNGSRFLAEILFRRGITSKRDALPFLYPDHYEPSNPFDFPMMDIACQKVAKVISDQEVIGIWGDFDADGQTAVAVLFEGLRRLTPNVIYHIPVRAKNSHGINIEDLSEFIQQKVTLLITCDTGVSEIKEIDFALKNGIETIITDHHTLPEKLPDAVAIINPHVLDPDHPMCTLSGVGVAYNFIRGLYQHFEKPQKWADNLLDLVAIGTVADLVPLLGESRYLTQRGIKLLQETSRPGLVELFNQNDIKQNLITEETISYSIAPRLNSMGRLGDANNIVKLLTTSSGEIARKITLKLERLNVERKSLSEMTTAAAIQILEKNLEWMQEPVIFLVSPEWKTSITGVVASRLVDIYKRPVFIIASPAGKPARGSVRSVKGIDIAQVLTEHQNLLVRFGGHSMASGFAIEPNNINLFKKAVLKSVAELQKGGTTKKSINIDAYIPLQFADNIKFVEQIELLRPFGQANRPLTFIDKNIRLLNVINFGKADSHRRLSVESKSNTQHGVIWWRGANEPLPDDCFDLIYTIKFSYYRGRRELQIEYIDSKECTKNIMPGLSLPASLEINDYRDCQKPIEKIPGILQSKSAIVYGEGFLDKKPKFTVLNRFQLHPSEALIISTIPPNYEIFCKIIETTKPQIIYLLKPITRIQTKTQFISYLTTCVLDAIKNDQGHLKINELAAATGHRTETISKALDFLVGRTTLSYIKNETESIQIGNFGQPMANTRTLMMEMDDLLEETSAFHRFYMRTDLNNIIGNIRLEFSSEP